MKCTRLCRQPRIDSNILALYKMKLVSKLYERLFRVLPLSQNISSKFAIGGASEMKQKSNYKNKAIGWIDVEKRGNVWKWHQISFLNSTLHVYLFK